MTLNELTDLMLRAADLATSKSASKLGQAMDIVARCEKALPGARWVPEVTCCYCKRQRRSWFATGVRRQRLWPLCSRACVTHWQSLTGGQVYVGYGREWADELPGRRAA